MHTNSKTQKNSIYTIVPNSRPLFCSDFTRYAPKKIRQRGIAVFDCETEDATLLGKIAGICFTSDIDYPKYEAFGQNGKERSCSIMFLQHFLQRRYQGYVAYAHKGLSFDVSHLLADKNVINWLTTHQYAVHIDKSFVKIRRKHQTWYFADSMRIIPEALANVLEKFAPEYTKTSLPSTRFSWHDESWKQRIINDTLGLFTSLKKITLLLDKTFHVPLQITLSSTALKAARSMLPIETIPRPCRKSLDWIRAGAFSGGRIEIYHQGKIEGNISVLDINSAYAWAMKGEFPVGRGCYVMNEPLSGYFIARCKVYVKPNTFIPPIISRLYHHAFTVGKFQAILTKEEILFARSVGAEVSFIEGWRWAKTFPLFKGFIEKCEVLRAQDYDGALGKTVKLLQNSVYGVLGMNTFRKAHLLSSSEPLLPWTHAFDIDRGGFIPHVYEATIYRESPTQMPHWAAIITARIRIHLTRYLLMAQQAGLQPLYSHTDSLWVVSPNGLPPTIQQHIGKEYGELKLAHTGKAATIVSSGEAMLTCHDGSHHIASKGWKADPEIFLADHTQEIEQVQMYRAGTALKRGKPGRKITKRVMDYMSLQNRIAPHKRPGNTSPKTAEELTYTYWNYKQWRIGKLLAKPPLASEAKMYGVKYAKKIHRSRSGLTQVEAARKRMDREFNEGYEAWLKEPGWVQNKGLHLTENHSRAGITR